VKDNQPKLKQAILCCLAPSLFRWREGQPPKTSHAQSLNHGHGRREERRLVARKVCPDQVDWPGAQQVFLLERRRERHGVVTEEVLCGVTSLPPERTDAQGLLSLVRGHWGIENRLFYVRDVSMGEDACRVRTGQGPRNLAIFRNLAIHLVRQVGGQGNVAAALRRHAAHPLEALALLQMETG
jgi:hypothetical protein